MEKLKGGFAGVLPRKGEAENLCEKTKLLLNH
jgi:hypothetical protein